MKKIGVIGAGFSGISSAACLAQSGYDVTVFEKNSSAGGRGRKYEANGFLFDMGPSWYWMPDVFEKFFNRFGKKVSDYYELKRLDPSYRVFYSKEDVWDIPAAMSDLENFFENIEKGSSFYLKKFIAEGKYKYDTGINKLVYKPGLSIAELIDVQLMRGVFKLHVFDSVSSYVRNYFKDPRLIQLLEFPVLFLGAAADKTPALYTLMNYADMALGTWYPMGGMHKIAEGMVKVAEEQGVKFQFNSAVEKFSFTGKRISGVTIHGVEQKTDAVVASADYHHVDQHLLPLDKRNYTPAYWESRTLAPSSLIFYLGVNKRLKNLLHHNLFFDRDFGIHAKEIYDHPQWPSEPLFYVSVPSITDPSVAPEGHENIFILMPVAPGLQDDDAIREQYFELIISRIESLTQQRFKENIIYKRSYAHSNFISDYNSFKGNAYGLANTLKQTANLKPSILNKNVPNLFFTGQLTVPGPGVPPAIISGQVVAKEVEARIG